MFVLFHNAWKRVKHRVSKIYYGAFLFGFLWFFAFEHIWSWAAKRHKALELQLTDFEDSSLYDKLTRARREAVQKLHAMRFARKFGLKNFMEFLRKTRKHWNIIKRIDNIEAYWKILKHIETLDRPASGPCPWQSRPWASCLSLSFLVFIICFHELSFANPSSPLAIEVCYGTAWLCWAMVLYCWVSPLWPWPFCWSQRCRLLWQVWSSPGTLSSWHGGPSGKTLLGSNEFCWKGCSSNKFGELKFCTKALKRMNLNECMFSLGNWILIWRASLQANLGLSRADLFGASHCHGCTGQGSQTFQPWSMALEALQRTDMEVGRYLCAV